MIDCKVQVCRSWMYVCIVDTCTVSSFFITKRDVGSNMEVIMPYFCFLMFEIR